MPPLDWRVNHHFTIDKLGLGIFLYPFIKRLASFLFCRKCFLDTPELEHGIGPLQYLLGKGESGVIHVQDVLVQRYAILSLTSPSFQHGQCAIRLIGQNGCATWHISPKNAAGKRRTAAVSK